MIFDVAILNPPYADDNQFLDTKFVHAVNKICGCQVAVHPGQRFIGRTKICLENILSGHLKAAILFDMNVVFHIHTKKGIGGIYVYDNTRFYDDITVTNEFTGHDDKVKCDTVKMLEYWRAYILFSHYFVDIVEKREHLREWLIEKYKTMVNDGHGFIYEENNLQRGKNIYGITKTNNIRLDRVKRYLKDGTYKYCIFTGSYNNQKKRYSEYEGQDVDALFKGQMCWLTNDENVKENIRYWLECPLCDMWIKYYNFNNNESVKCRYGILPAVDFELDTDAFRKEVDTLNDFTADEIRELKKYNICNIDRYDF